MTKSCITLLLAVSTFGAATMSSAQAFIGIGDLSLLNNSGVVQGLVIRGDYDVGKGAHPLLMDGYTVKFAEDGGTIYCKVYKDNKLVGTAHELPANFSSSTLSNKKIAIKKCLKDAGVPDSSFLSWQ
ncbi:MAG: hypothetical protein AB7L92_07960 [Alphaproteobacteria bacterium]